jgi:hypothetical protein
VGAYNAACTQLSREACTAQRHAYAAKVHAALAGGRREVREPSAEGPNARASEAGILSVRMEGAAQDADGLPDEAAATPTRAEQTDG